MKYWIKYKYKHLLSLLFLLLSIYLFFSPSNLLKGAGTILIIISAKLSQDLFKDFLQSVLISTITVFYILVTISWWFDLSILILTYTFEITDNRMLVLVTILYVLLSYLVLNNSKRQFDVSRVPVLREQRSGLSFKFSNESCFIAKNLITTIEFIYPLHKNRIQRIFSFIKFKKRKIEFKTKDIYPNDYELVEFQKESCEILPIQYKSLNRDCSEVYITKDKKQIDFDLILSYTYETDTGFRTPKEIKQKYCLSILKDGSVNERRMDQKIHHKTFRIM